jgi:hypothetical protein
MAHHTSHHPYSPITKWCLLAAIVSSILGFSTTTHAQGLGELLESEAMRKITRAGRNSDQASIGDADPDSNFASLWRKGNSPAVLAAWLGVRMAGFKITTQSSGLHPEYAGAHAILENPSGIKVFIDIQVPRDSYAPMAQLKTLNSFNRFRPPDLDVIAQQVLPIQGIEANYYRTRMGSCSLLFPIERYGIVNLRVEKCLDSKVMMEVAKTLTFSRLNQKLVS